MFLRNFCFNFSRRIRDDFVSTIADVCTQRIQIRMMKKYRFDFKNFISDFRFQNLDLVWNKKLRNRKSKIYNMSYWLVKSEPSAYGWEQLEKDKRTDWTGVRNFAARNHLKSMKKGDEVLYYHSNEGLEFVGVAKV